MYDTVGGQNVCTEIFSLLSGFVSGVVKTDNIGSSILYCTSELVEHLAVHVTITVVLRFIKLTKIALVLS